MISREQSLKGSCAEGGEGTSEGRRIEARGRKAGGNIKLHTLKAKGTDTDNKPSTIGYEWDGSVARVKMKHLAR